VHAFEVLADPVRRRLVELLALGERSAGELTGAVTAEFGISQPAGSQHLRVLREHGFAAVRPDGNRRVYALDPDGLAPVRGWLDRLDELDRLVGSAGFDQPLDALATEVARGHRLRRRTQKASGQAPSASTAAS
jgi:DNA-binding transcriptional ArsR family regulator